MKSSLRERFNISRWALKFPRLTIAFWLAVAVAGLFALSSLKYALFPDITLPVVVVSAQAPIETVLETESQLTRPIEAPLRSLDRLDDVYSSTYPGQSVTNILFVRGAQLQASTDAVKQALKTVSLPANTKLDVIPIDLSESSAISYAILSDSQTLEELTQIAQSQIIPKIEQIPGVLKVNLLGDAAINPLQSPSSSLIPNFPTLVRFNGQDALGFQVIKEGQANTLEIVSRVEQAKQQLQNQLPQIQLVLAETQATYINEATKATIDALIGAVILAILIIFPFLRSFSATLITALSIPLSLLGTCIVMALFKFNLETITLLALTLVIGIVVDDAIVDVENIMRRIDAGETPKQAAIKGTDEIGLTVTASTLSIVAVFLPVALMNNAVGEFFKPFGITVSAAVLISLLVARTLSPVLAVYWLKPQQNRQGFPENRQAWLTHHYRQILRWSLHHRQIVLGIAIFSFVAGVALIPLIPKGFIPKLDRGDLNVVYTVPLPKLASSLPLGDTETQPGQLVPLNTPKPQTETGSPTDGGFDWITELAKSPERLLLRKTIRVGKQLETVVLAIPDVESVFTIAGLRGEPNKGKLYVRLKENRSLTTAEAQAQVRAALPTLKGVSVSVEDIPFVQTEADTPLQIGILGDDNRQLAKVAQEIKTRVEKLPGLTDVALSGLEKEGETFLRLDRLHGKYVIYLSANLTQQQGLEDSALQIEELAQPLLSPGISLKRWGNSAHSRDVLTSFGGTMIGAIALMLLLLFLLFGRLLEPIVVGLSLPLSLVGAMLGLLITQSDFGVISLLGLIFLIGLLNKNSLLLLDYINQMRQKGLSREEAVLETGTVRLRPIIMTTASTILGMLPIALGLGAGAELRQPMAVAIIGGLTTSSLLSLIVVPVLYTLLEDAWGKMSAKEK